MSEPPKDKNFFSEWLEKLQQESWQLELLISGFAIYGLFSFRDYIEDSMYHILKFDRQTLLVFMLLGFSVLYSAVIIFITNLLIHVLVRGLWIGAIGLRYVSGEIEYDQLKYSPKFIRYYKRTVGSFDSYIEKLEKFASILFSYTFLLFFIFLSFFIFLVFFFGSATMLTKLVYGADTTSNVQFAFGYSWLGNIASVLLLIHLLFAILVFFDFITLGLLKRIKQKHISTVYFWIYRYISFITLSFLWRPLLLNFLDSRFTRILFILAVPYGFVVSAFFPSLNYVGSAYFPELNIISNFDNDNIQLNKNMYHPKFYDDELVHFKKEIRRTGLFSLPSKKVKGKVFEVFIRRITSDEKLVSLLDSTISKINNNGFISELFSSTNFETEIEKQLNTAHDQMMDSLKSIHRAKIKDASNEDELKEQWNVQKDELNQVFEKQITDLQEQNLKKLKALLQSTFTFKVNDQVINSDKLDCDFYIHPETKQNGMLCFFPIDSLPLGRNYLTYDKLYVRGKSTLDTVSTTIPFIYEGK